MPGVISFRDSKLRLDNLKKTNPELFNQRNVYVEVHKMFESYTFKLAVRRDIVNYFTLDARMKHQRRTFPYSNSSEENFII